MTETCNQKINKLTVTKLSGKSSLSMKILYFLVAFMPLHYFICELFLSNSSIDNLFRDAVIFMLLVMLLFKGNFKINGIGIIIILSMVIMVINALFSYSVNGYPATFNILRTYMVPMLTFFIVSNLSFDKSAFDGLHKLIVVELGIIGIYGFLQAFLLGDDFLIKIGYSSNGKLGYSFYISGFYGFQRVVGTFVSPNICGIILVAGLCILLCYNFRLKYKKLFFLFLILGILGTISRSAILGAVVAAVFLFILLKKWKKINLKTIQIIVLSAIIICLLVYSIDALFFNGLFFSMLKSSVLSTVTGTDSSMKKHIEDLLLPFSIIFEHPLGLGFGNNGPIALSHSADANVVESSIFLIVYEMGIIGALIFFIPFIYLIVRTVKDKKYKYYVPACFVIAELVTFILLPNIQQYEIIFYSYLFMGLYFNPSVKKLKL